MTGISVSKMAEHRLMIEIIWDGRQPALHQKMQRQLGIWFCKIDLRNTLACQLILSEELNMRRIAAKFVPRLLQNEQKQHHLSILLHLMFIYN
jgi:site-specific recombinase